MTHRRLNGSMPPAEAYPIEVRIRVYSQAGLVPEELDLFWRLKGQGDWQEIPLEATPDSETFVASIPGAADGQKVEYFLYAADRSGRRESLPRTAPDGFYFFTVASGNQRE